jgi:hypothetical protein
MLTLRYVVEHTFPQDLASWATERELTFFFAALSRLWPESADTEVPERVTTPRIVAAAREAVSR